LIIGTAGHVDHGKTALVKALTGIECDTHKEEKARGITINLGFAHLELSPGNSVGIVDVPGHRDFVHTMVGGASGMDLALLVVAADGGVMPQTREHLEIMDVLGIRSGLVALNRIDLADETIVAMAEEEVRGLLAGTFLASAPIVRVSALTGAGIAELKTQIAVVAGAVEERFVGDVFRMFVDRIFSVSGFGTVVTGSVIGGALSEGDEAFLLPSDKGELRVRRIERHGLQVGRVVAGDRASINLVGLNREDFQRGMIVSNRRLNSTTMLDAKLRLFPDRQRIGIWSNTILHLGTFEDAVRVHLIDRDVLSGGETAIVQIHSTRLCPARHGDRFVIRNTSSDLTLGGGEVIDASPLHHRRRPEALVRNLQKVASGARRDMVFAEIAKRMRAVDHHEVAENLNLCAADVLAEFTEGFGDEVRTFVHEGVGYALTRARYERLQEDICRCIGAHHRRNPLQKSGRSKDELMGILGMAAATPAEAVLGLTLGEMVRDGRLKTVGRTWVLAEHDGSISPEVRDRIAFVESFLRKSGMQTPLISELAQAAARRGVEEPELHQFLRYLVSEKRAYYIDGNYIHASVVDGCRDTLVKELAGRPQGVTVADFRDMVGGNRKICLLLLAIYDGEGVTVRREDVRVLGKNVKAQ
jgi:selenocysteine-specific elongation factor